VPRTWLDIKKVLNARGKYLKVDNTENAAELSGADIVDTHERCAG
jgi:hypothetical protein